MCHCQSHCPSLLQEKRPTKARSRYSASQSQTHSHLVRFVCCRQRSLPKLKSANSSRRSARLSVRLASQLSRQSPGPASGSRRLSSYRPCWSHWGWLYEKSK